MTDTITINEIVEQLKGIEDNEGKEAFALEIAAVVAASMGVAELEQFKLTLIKVGLTKHFVNTAVQRVIKAEKKRAEAQRIDEQSSKEQAMYAGAIVCNDRQLGDVMEDALGAIAAYNSSNHTQPIVYVRAGALTEVATDENDGLIAYGVNNHRARNILGKVADWVTVTKRSDGYENYTNVFPPIDVCNSLITQTSGWPGVPALDQIVSHPLYAKDGSLHIDFGYSPATKSFNSWGIGELPDIEPTSGNVQWARAFINDNLLVDFPLKDDASRAHCYALIIQPFVRPLIDGPTPLYAISAPAPGSGKGKLAEVLSFPAIGSRLPSIAITDSEEEFRKILGTELKQMTSHIFFDNVQKPLTSASLASATTQALFKYRFLGVNDSANLPIRCTWIVTGNNLVLDSDLARRAMYIRLDANMERPDTRTGFKHDVSLWAQENRDDLIRAVLILINNWVAGGMVRQKEAVKGSYEQWSGVIGGILKANDITGFLANDDELRESVNVENASMYDFVGGWHEKYGTADVTVKDLFIIASTQDDGEAGEEGENLLGDRLTQKSEGGRLRALGKILSSSVDVVFDDMKIKRASKDTRRPKFRLEYVGDPANDPDDGIEF